MKPSEEILEIIREEINELIIEMDICAKDKCYVQAAKYQIQKDILDVVLARIEEDSEDEQQQEG